MQTSKAKHPLAKCVSTSDQDVLTTSHDHDVMRVFTDVRSMVTNLRVGMPREFEASDRLYLSWRRKKE